MIRPLKNEWLDSVERDYNHPCIVAWTPLNESLGVECSKKFITAIKKCKLTVLSEPWWYYEYQIFVDRIVLELYNASDLEVENDMITRMTSTLEHTLLSVGCDYLSIDEYAAMHRVESATVLNWIKRGKLRHAKKKGSDWQIPNTEDRPHRGFSSVQYVVEEGSHIQSDEFPM